MLVVDDGSKVALRPVTIDERIGDLYIVTSGLKAGERVIVDGVQKVRPGMQVKAELKAAVGAAPAPAAPAPDPRAAGRQAEGRRVALGPVLHRPPDRRDRHRDHDRPARGLRAHRAQHRAVSLPRPAHDPRHGHVSGRLGGRGGAVGGHAGRAGSQRRGIDDLHAVVQHERRPHAPRRQLHGGRRSGQGQCAHPEPRHVGPGASAAGSERPGRDREEAEPEHPDARLGLLARGGLRRELPDQLLRDQPAGPAPAHPRHRPGGPVRRHRLRHAHLAPARQSWPSWG